MIIDANAPPTPPPGMNFGSGKLGVDPDAEVVESVGRLIEFWGFRRALGRVWALLYLSPQPLPAVEIGDRLTMSLGAVSMALNELQLWGTVVRAYKPAGRKECFAAEEDIWKMAARVLSDRELREVESACDTFARAEQSLKQRAQEAREQAATEQRDELDFRRARVGHLRKFALSGRALLTGLINRRN